MTVTARETEQFKITEIGLLPSEWGLATLGDLFHIQQGKALSPKSRQGISPRPFLRTANVLWGHLDLSTVDQMDFSEEEAIKLALLPGDLLVCEGGDIGRTAMWRGELPACYYQNHIHRLRPIRDDALPEYYMYWMQAALLLLDLYIGQGNRTTIPNLSGARLKAYVVPVPPPPEQKKIAYVLSTVHSTIEKTRAVINAIRELKKSVMKHLFTYGPVRIDEVESILLNETEIGLVPAGWEVVRVGNIARKLIGGGTPQTSRSEYWGGEIQWTTSKRITGIHLMEGEKRITNRGLEESATHLVPKGNLIIGTRVGVGKVAINEVDVAISQDLTGAIINSREYVPEFLAYQISTDRLQRIFTQCMRGTTIKGIPRDELVKIPLVIPPYITQKNIADTISAVDTRIEAEENREQALETLFKTLLSRLVTGKIRVNSLEVPG